MEEIQGPDLGTYPLRRMIGHLEFGIFFLKLLDEFSGWVQLLLDLPATTAAWGSKAGYRVLRDLEILETTSNASLSL